jgi:hypothetical protein
MVVAVALLEGVAGFVTPFALFDDVAFEPESSISAMMAATVERPARLAQR